MEEEFEIVDNIFFFRQETISRIHSKSRIRVVTTYMILTIFGCIWAIWSGKNEAAKGDNLQKRILREKQKIKEDYLAELEKKIT